MAVPSVAVGQNDSIRDCVRACAGGETMPVLTSFPRIDIADVPQSSAPSSEHPYGTGNLGQTGMHGTVVYSVVIKVDGTTDRPTLHVVSSTARDWEPVLKRALDDARFRPAYDAGRAVQARVQVMFEIRAGGVGNLCLTAGVTATSHAQRPLESCYTSNGGE
jgi:hypothetical protein